MTIKIALFYYSQTGQAALAAQRLFKDIDTTTSVVFKAIVPEREYPFPWKKYDFFDTFPETRLHIPPSGIRDIDYSDIGDADLVVIVGQSWFLSPSLPLQSFFADPQVRVYLSHRKVVFVNVCRNMWIMTSRWLREYFKSVQAQWVGHIVLEDRNPNLISAATIVRWLIGGRKEGKGLLPSAGVSDTDLERVRFLGPIIERHVKESDCGRLQEELLSAGAIHYAPSILFIERLGHRMFGLWAKFIRVKGGMGDKRRKWRVWAFYYYLLFVLFVVSPFVQLLFFLTYPLHRVNRHRDVDCKL